MPCRLHSLLEPAEAKHSIGVITRFPDSSETNKTGPPSGTDGSRFTLASATHRRTAAYRQLKTMVSLLLIIIVAAGNVMARSHKILHNTTGCPSYSCDDGVVIRYPFWTDTGDDTNNPRCGPLLQLPRGTTPSPASHTATQRVKIFVEY